MVVKKIKRIDVEYEINQEPLCKVIEILQGYHGELTLDGFTRIMFENEPTYDDAEMVITATRDETEEEEHERVKRENEAEQRYNLREIERLKERLNELCRKVD